ncbi:unannotated protein [freshwater metagenome]|uniref:Unannotated protein n=1 Tax=freshwater metagenome TaxID=449393 RepID=A0A6J7E0I4_9ZZZZ|nr:hypothetical protein [Actinomycetota bacterium]
MTAPDPFELLGLDRAASLAEVRVARRRLAFDRHPDRGGNADDMRVLNAAFDAAVGHLTGRRPLPEAPVGATSTPDPATTSPTAAAGRPTPGQHRSGRVQHDVPSFVVAALPAEAFEALLVVTSWVGEVLVDDPPYVLEVHLREPAECWCRLDLVPDAGASTVSITVAPSGDGAPPLLDDVRDMWVQNLNQPGVFE